MKWFYKFIYFQLMGWKLEGEIEESTKKCVIAVVPHTSWHDFYLGVFVRGVMKSKLHFIAKKELFIFPFGTYFRWMGGAAIDRTSGQNKVEAIAEIFKDKSVFRLAMSPEGTRKKVEKWRTGFYYIAKTANVPIVMVAFDYATKTVKIAPPFMVSDDFDSDIGVMKSFYKGSIGKVPSNT